MTIPGQITDLDSAAKIEGFAQSLPAVTPENFRRVWQDCADAGLLALIASGQFGGQQKPTAEFIQTMLAFGRGCGDSGLALGLTSQIWTIQHLLQNFGNEDQKHAYLPDLIAGKFLGAFALTESNSGSDALNCETRAQRDGDSYVINGAKAFVGMGPDCDLAIIFASTAPDKGKWGLSAFIVEVADAGFYRGARQSKMGLNTIPMGHLTLKDCRIPEGRRIGPEGAGAAIIQAALDWERCFILTCQVGAMERQLTECAGYAAERSVFGQRIADFQSVSNRLADMRVRLETCRLMLSSAADLHDRGQPLTQFAAMVNLHISESFLNSSMDAMRNFGGIGYLAGSSAHADISDAVGGVIYSGTSDIQRQIIAKMELGQLRRLGRKEQT